MAQAVPFFGSPAPGLSGRPLPVFMAQPTGQFFTMFPPPEVFGEAVGEQLPTGPAEQGNSRTKKRQKTASRLPSELPPRAVDPVAPRPVVAGPTHQESRAQQELASAGWGKCCSVYRAAYDIADIEVNVIIRNRERARARKEKSEDPYAALLEQDKEILAERALFLRDGIERSRLEQVRRAKYDLVSTSEFPKISSAQGLRRFVRATNNGEGPTAAAGAAGGVVTNHHHHILGSSMALWCNGRTTVLLAEETLGCCAAALEAGGWRRMELPIVSTEEELLAAAEMEGDEGDAGDEAATPSAATPSAAGSLQFSPDHHPPSPSSTIMSPLPPPPIFDVPPPSVPHTLNGYRVNLMGNGAPFLCKEAIIQAGTLRPSPFSLFIQSPHAHSPHAHFSARMLRGVPFSFKSLPLLQLRRRRQLAESIFPALAGGNWQTCRLRGGRRCTPTIRRGKRFSKSTIW